MTLTCDRCDKTFDVGAAAAGTKVACPACGDVNVVPGPGRAQPAPTASDRAAAAGLPPASGPEVSVLRVKGAPFRTRPLSTLALIVVALAGIAGAGIFGSTGALPLAGIAAACALAAMVTLAAWFVASWSMRLEVTNKRVVFTKGLLSKTTVEMLHRTIQDIEIKQSVLDRLLRVGTINIANASEDDDAIVLRDVPEPYRVRATIDVYRPM